MSNVDLDGEILSGSMKTSRDFDASVMSSAPPVPLAASTAFPLRTKKIFTPEASLSRHSMGLEQVPPNFEDVSFGFSDEDENTGEEKAQPRPAQVDAGRDYLERSRTFSDAELGLENVDFNEASTPESPASKDERMSRDYLVSSEWRRKFPMRRAAVARGGQRRQGDSFRPPAGAVPSDVVRAAAEASHGGGGSMENSALAEKQQPERRATPLSSTENLIDLRSERGTPVQNVSGSAAGTGPKQQSTLFMTPEESLRMFSNKENASSHLASVAFDNSSQLYTAASGLPSDLLASSTEEQDDPDRPRTATPEIVIEDFSAPASPAKPSERLFDEEEQQAAIPDDNTSVWTVGNGTNAPTERTSPPLASYVSEIDGQQSELPPEPSQQDVDISSYFRSGSMPIAPLSPGDEDVRRTSVGVGSFASPNYTARPLIDSNYLPSPSGDVKDSSTHNGNISGDVFSTPGVPASLLTDQHMPLLDSFADPTTPVEKTSGHSRRIRTNGTLLSPRSQSYRSGTQTPIATFFDRLLSKKPQPEPENTEQMFHHRDFDGSNDHSRSSSSAPLLPGRKDSGAPCETRRTAEDLPVVGTSGRLSGRSPGRLSQSNEGSDAFGLPDSLLGAPGSESMVALAESMDYFAETGAQSAGAELAASLFNLRLSAEKQARNLDPVDMGRESGGGSNGGSQGIVSGGQSSTSPEGEFVAERASGHGFQKTSTPIHEGASHGRDAVPRLTGSRDSGKKLLTSVGSSGSSRGRNRLAPFANGDSPGVSDVSYTNTSSKYASRHDSGGWPQLSDTKGVSPLAHDLPAKKPRAVGTPDHGNSSEYAARDQPGRRLESVATIDGTQPFEPVAQSTVRKSPNPNRYSENAPTANLMDNRFSNLETEDTDPNKVWSSPVANAEGNQAGGLDDEFLVPEVPRLNLSQVSSSENSITNRLDTSQSSRVASSSRFSQQVKKACSMPVIQEDRAHSGGTSHGLDLFSRMCDERSAA